MKQVFIHLAEGFEEIEAITIIDVLRRAGLNVLTVSISDNIQVTGAHQITVLADQVFSETDYSKAEMIILPGGMPGSSNLDQHAGLKEQIAKFNLQKKWIGAICAAPFVLGKLDILRDHEAVCYPGYEKFLEGAKVSQAQVAVSEHLITSRGVGTALPFALTIVEKLVSAEKARQLAEAMLVQNY